MRYLPVIRILFLIVLMTVSFAPLCAAQTAASPRAISPAAQQVDPYTPHLPARAYAYHRAYRVLLTVSIAWHILGLVLFLRSGLSATVRDTVERLLQRRNSVAGARQVPGKPPSFAETALYYGLYSSVLLLWSLPIGLSELAIERRFGFSHESIGLFLRDDLLNLCLSWAIIPLVWLGYRLYARQPRRWWIYVWSALVPLTFFVMVVYPVVISPLFNRYTPLEAGPLRDRILALAAKAGIHNGRVYVEDTSRRTAHVNAYVIGIGPTTRIVLNDTALRQLPEDQILAVVGHEMGHYVEHHVLVNVAVGAVGSGILLRLLAILIPGLLQRFGPRFRLRGTYDLAALPLIMLTIYLLTFVGEPFSNAISRYLEHRADAYGLRVTGLSDATARLMVGFAERDLSDPDPPLLLHLWFGTHPKLSERIDFARHYPDHRP